MFDPQLTEMIVHDLRNPLAGMTGAADLLGEGLLGPLTEEQKKHVENIRLAGKILARQLMDIKEISNFENSSAEVNLASFPVSELLEKLKWLIQYAERENKQIIVSVASALAIKADKEWTVRILENLLLNAVKQTKSGEQAKLNIRSGLFEVIDFGEVLPQEYWSRAFDKLFKIEHPEFKTRIGCGLGLYFCKLVVEAQGGKIWLESTAEKGTIIGFTLKRG